MLSVAVSRRLQPERQKPSLRRDRDGVDAERDRAAIGSPLKMTYSSTWRRTRPFRQDYWVFVHVLDDQGDSLWGDDHQPPQPTSTWKPGQRVEYTRTVFVPNYPYIGPAHVRVGLYQPTRASGCRSATPSSRGSEYEVREVPAAAAVREHLPDL